jgi:hypothetical protein
MLSINLARIQIVSVLADQAKFAFILRARTDELFRP